jgi:hypothetical protein
MFLRNSAEFQRNTRRYIPEDTSTIRHNHRCENLKSYRLEDFP